MQRRNSADDLFCRLDAEHSLFDERFSPNARSSGAGLMKTRVFADRLHPRIMNY
jgi:hypothetical protein